MMLVIRSVTIQELVLDHDEVRDDIHEGFVVTNDVKWLGGSS